ncbi:MAG TPA: hypothetical protein PKH69_02425 [Thiobacillaceae bacterium]|nr:hypothetical protein [Thiobacillaceae bacterium]HNU62943.1 hypothetical protein [Thiobacillaceae bacterium]
MLVLGLLLQTEPLSAADDQLQWHGFLSQAVVHTNDNNVGGHSDDGLGLDMREVGANVSYRPNGDWLFSGQLLARWAGASDEGDPRVDYAFADRTLISDDSRRIGIQVGKVKNPYGLYNTTRDVAHTRPGILMPQSVYLDRIRDFYLAAPGVSLYGNHVHADWEINWRVNAMRPETDSKDLEHLFMLRDSPGSYHGRNSWLGQILAERDGGKLRLGLTLGQVKARYRPGMPDVFSAGESTLKPRLLSLEWNSENWSITGEYGRIRNQGRGYGPFGAGLEDPNTVETWYLQGTYRLDPALQVYLRRDAFYLNRKDRHGAGFAAATGLPPYLGYAEGWVLGARRDLGAWAFSGEVHRTEGTGWLSPMDTPLLSQRKNWRMLLLQAAYRF